MAEKNTKRGGGGLCKRVIEKNIMAVSMVRKFSL